jgi:hypothetical protein
VATNPIYQYELSFTHQKSGQGWREQLAWQGGGSSIFDGGTDWAQQRRPFLSADCAIIGFSRRRIDGTKDSISFLFDTPYQGQSITQGLTQAGVCNTPANTIEYEVYSANRANRRCFYFRGIEDGWVTGGSLTPFGGARLASVEAYLTWLKNGGASIRTQANTWVSAASVGNKTTTQGSPIIVSAPGLNPPITGNLTIFTKGFRNYPYLNGRWVGLYDSTDAVSLGTASGRYNVSLVGVGYVRLNNITVQQINTWFFARVGNRKTGLTPLALRGKKSKKVVHR